MRRRIAAASLLHLSFAEGSGVGSSIWLSSLTKCRLNPQGVQSVIKVNAMGVATRMGITDCKYTKFLTPLQISWLLEWCV